MDSSPVKSDSWAAFAVEALVDDEALTTEPDSIYEFRIDGEMFTLEIANGSARVTLGPAVRSADLIVTADAESFAQIGSGMLNPVAALESGAIDMQGSITAILHCCRVLGISLDKP